MSHLIQASHLTWQQILRGISTKTALLNSFSDVYIKPRTGSDFVSNINTPLAEMKNNMLKALENEAEKMECTEIHVNDVIHTLSVKGLCNNSSYEIAKQIAFPIIMQINTEENSDNWSYLFNIVIAYQKCSKETLPILHYIIKECIKSMKNNKIALINQVNEKAYDIVLKNDASLSTYRRFYPESEDQNEEIILKSNTALVLLYNNLQKLFTQTENGKQFTAIAYSKAVLSKEIPDDFLEYPILHYCNIYLKLVDDEIVNAIKEQNSCKDKDVCVIIQLLNWRTRFLKICSLPIFEITKRKIPILKEGIIPLLNVHSRWLQKYLISELSKITGRDINKFNTDFTIMTLNNQNDSQVILKLSKKLRKIQGQPNLYENETEQSLCIQRSEMYNSFTLDMEQPIHKQIPKIKPNLTPVLDLYATDVPNPITLKTIQENISNIGNVDLITMNIKLLPINLYIIQRIICLLRSDLLNIISNINSGNKTYALTNNFVDLLIYLVNIAKETKGFPPTLLSLLKVVQNINNGDINYNK